LLVDGDDAVTNMDAIPFGIGDSAVCGGVFGGRVKLALDSSGSAESVLGFVRFRFLGDMRGRRRLTW
jgi:hypothetical protein